MVGRSEPGEMSTWAVPAGAVLGRRHGARDPGHVVPDSVTCSARPGYERVLRELGADGDAHLELLVWPVSDLHRDPALGEAGRRAHGDAELVLQGRGVALEVDGLVGGEQEVELLVAEARGHREDLAAVGLAGVAGDRGGRARRCRSSPRSGIRPTPRRARSPCCRGRGRGRGGALGRAGGGGAARPRGRGPAGAAHQDRGGDADRGREHDGAGHQRHQPKPSVGCGGTGPRRASARSASAAPASRHRAAPGRWWRAPPGRLCPRAAPGDPQPGACAPEGPADPHPGGAHAGGGQPGAGLCQPAAAPVEEVLVPPRNVSRPIVAHVPPSPHHE